MFPLADDDFKDHESPYSVIHQFDLGSYAILDHMLRLDLHPIYQNGVNEWDTFFQFGIDLLIPMRNSQHIPHYAMHLTNLRSVRPSVQRTRGYASYKQFVEQQLSQVFS